MAGEGGRGRREVREEAYWIRTPARREEDGVSRCKCTSLPGEGVCSPGLP